jgi:hypothetical protein
MKKIILGSVLAVAAVTSVSVQAATQTFCSGGGATTGAAASVVATGFVQQAFTPKCSTNVFLIGDDLSSTVYRVGAASAKGKSRFGGSSVGGAVSGTICASSTACVASDAAAAQQAAASS